MAYTLRTYQPGDEAALVDLFNRVMCAADPTLVPRTLAEWRWNHSSNPAGLRLFVAEHAGQIVGQYGGWPLRVDWNGGTHTFVHVGDSIVLPEHRAGLKRPGLFASLGELHFATHGGPDKDIVHYGLPIDRAWRLGQKIMHYELLRPLLVHVREPGPGSAALPLGVERLERFDDQQLWLYHRCARDCGASVVRIKEFSNWRFLEHPARSYECYGVRDGGGVLRGVLVYRRMDLVVPNMGVAVDWQCPSDEPEVGAVLLETLLALGRRDHARAVCATFPEWSAWFGRFQESGFLVHPSPWYMCVRTFHPRLGDMQLRAAWWYQLADTDLV